MFLPGRNVQEEKRIQRMQFARVEKLCLSLIPPGPLRDAVTISAHEVQCGDPTCAPIDTVITIQFPQSGGQGMFGIPMEAREVNKEELQHLFPTPEVLEQWYLGHEADWPPVLSEAVEPPMQALRFAVGTPVECRVGPEEWAAGTVIQLWYREPDWPTGSFAPYKIELLDGPNIFAPADMDQIIRRRNDTTTASGGDA